jgi:hypothetical protein
MHMQETLITVQFDIKILMMPYFSQCMLVGFINSFIIREINETKHCKNGTLQRDVFVSAQYVEIINEMKNYYYYYTMLTEKNNGRFHFKRHNSIQTILSVTSIATTQSYNFVSSSVELCRLKGFACIK